MTTNHATPARPIASLSYINVFARDIEALSGFYMTVFGFTEIMPIRSPIFRGVDTGRSSLGFNALKAYDLLGLHAHAETAGCSFLLNFDVDSADQVDRLVPAAVAHGAQLVKPPYRTYYDWYQAVLLDPEQNVFRINHVLPIQP
jgi:uncharacterized glyoxalase superfamily protein PhnB